MSTAGVNAEVELVDLPAPNLDASQGADSLDPASNTSAQHGAQAEAGQEVPVVDSPPKTSKLRKCFAWLGSSKFSNILALLGIVLTLVAILWAVLAQRWAVKNGNLQTCAALTQIGRQTSLCNLTLNAGLPSFFDWRRSLSPSDADSFDFNTSAQRWKGTIWAIVVTLGACIAGLVHIRPRMSVFTPMISAVRLELIGCGILLGPTESDLLRVRNVMFGQNLLCTDDEQHEAHDYDDAKRRVTKAVLFNNESEGEVLSKVAQYRESEQQAPGQDVQLALLQNFYDKREEVGTAEVKFARLKAESAIVPDEEHSIGKLYKFQDEFYTNALTRAETEVRQTVFDMHKAYLACAKHKCEVICPEAIHQMNDRSEARWNILANVAWAFLRRTNGQVAKNGKRGFNFEDEFENSSSEHDTALPNTPDIPPAVEIYFKRANEVDWLTKRIDELESEQVEDRTNADCRQELSDATHARQHAIMCRSRAKEACLKQGIDPGSYERPKADRLEVDLADQLQHGSHEDALFGTNFVALACIARHALQEVLANLDQPFQGHLLRREGKNDDPPLVLWEPKANRQSTLDGLATADTALEVSLSGVNAWQKLTGGVKESAFHKLEGSDLMISLNFPHTGTSDATVEEFLARSEESDFSNVVKSPRKKRKVGIRRDKYRCVFFGSNRTDMTEDCSTQKQYVSQLRRHHERHNFFYCTNCFNNFPSAGEREIHAESGLCSFTCVTESCPIYGITPLSSQGMCNHRRGENAQRDQWRCLYRLARPNDQPPNDELRAG